MFIYWHYREVIAWYGNSMDELAANKDDKGFKANIAMALLFGKYGISDKDREGLKSDAFKPPGELLEFARDYEAMLVNITAPVDGIRALRQSANAVSQYWLEITKNAYEEFWDAKECQTRIAIEALPNDLGVTLGKCRRAKKPNECPEKCGNKRCDAYWWLRGEYRREALAMARTTLEMTRGRQEV